MQKIQIGGNLTLPEIKLRKKRKLERQVKNYIEKTAGYTLEQQQLDLEYYLLNKSALLTGKDLVVFNKVEGRLTWKMELFRKFQSTVATVENAVNAKQVSDEALSKTPIPSNVRF